MSDPICSIRLPSHHPAVQGLKKGQKVSLEAEHAGEDEMEPMMGSKPSGPRPPPLETKFNVTGINKAKGAGAGERSAKGKKVSAMEYLKGNRGQPAGAKVSEMT